MLMCGNYNLKLKRLIKRVDFSKRLFIMKKFRELLPFYS